MTSLNARNNRTFHHSWRVAEISTLIASSMDLSENIIELTHLSAYLHDIGKIGTPDSILNKPGRLQKDEFLEIQKHPVIGYRILNKIPNFNSVANIVLHHHERYDGQGYPDELKENEIPLISRIISVADAFDAITSNRSYRKAKSYNYAYREINDHVYSQFCPVVIKHFNNIFDLIPNVIENVEKDINGDISIDNRWHRKIDEVEHNELIHSKKII